MPSDLDYFYECDLDRKNLSFFDESLSARPLLQHKFEASLHADISVLNVLQGYRGPAHMCNGGSGDSQVLHPSHGMQEIKYWWGLRKDSMWSGGGTVTYPLERLGQKLGGQLDWSSLYFDSKTGECLSHDKNEAAERLNQIGRRLYKEGKYSQAAEYHNNAYHACANGYRHEQKFKNNAEKAELKAKERRSNSDSHRHSSRNSVTRHSNCDSDDDDDDDNDDDDDDDTWQSAFRKRCDDRRRRDEQREAVINANEKHASNLYCLAYQSYEEGNYRGAEAIFHEALNVSQVPRHQQICYNGMIAARNEQNALELNIKGNALFLQGYYSEAICFFQDACDKSQKIDQRQKCELNVKKAQDEIDAKNLNSEGNTHFRQREYSQARDKYQEAIDMSKVRKERDIYAANRDLAEIEYDADILNYRGNGFYNQGKYNEAISLYQQACNRSQTDSRKQVYTANRIKAQTEKEALQLYSEGDNFFKQRKYNEAHGKFQDARKKSKVTAQIKKFQAMEDKAKIEIDAMQLNSQGDNLFNLGKYSDALRNYQQACNTSRVSIEQEIYSANIGKAQAIISKLDMLDTLWKQAWDAENGESCDEANALFARILTESRRGLEIFPGSSKLKQYETLVTLKVEGNELFNQGLECQQNGITLFEEAQELKQRENYESANVKFKQAKVKFLDAQEKFETGNKSDQRFSSCVEFVQEQIEAVTDSIKVTEQFMLSHGLHNLHLEVDNHATTPSCRPDEVDDHINYSAHI